MLEGSNGATGHLGVNTDALIVLSGQCALHGLVFQGDKLSAGHAQFVMAPTAAVLMVGCVRADVEHFPLLAVLCDESITSRQSAHPAAPGLISSSNSMLPVTWK